MKGLLLGFIVLLLSSCSSGFSEAKFQVKYMSCESCTRDISEALLKEKKYKTADVDFNSKTLSITANEGQTFTKKEIKTVLTNMGYDLE